MKRAKIEKFPMPVYNLRIRIRLSDDKKTVQDFSHMMTIPADIPEKKMYEELMTNCVQSIVNQMFFENTKLYPGGRPPKSIKEPPTVEVKIDGR